MSRISAPTAAALSAVLLSASVIVGDAQVFRQRLDLVTVDVSVVDGRGAPVTGLTADDFEVTADSTPRRIVVFRPPAAAVSEGERKPSEKSQPSTTPERLVVLVIQRDQIPQQDGRRFLDAAANFVDTLPASYDTGLWAMPASTELHIERNRTALKERIRALQGTLPRPMSMLTVTPDEAVAIAALRDPDALAAAVARECARLAVPDPSCPQQIQDEARRKYQEVSVVAANTLRTFEQLFTQLLQVEGPKHVILISTGPAQTLDNQELLERVARQASAARIHVHAVQVPYMQDPIGADTMGRPAPPPKQHLSTGYGLAAETGGLALTPSDPRVAFRRIGNELAATYELGIEAKPEDRDGKPHRIIVRVPSRSDLSLRARREFVLAPLTTTQSTPAPPPAPVANAVENPDPPPPAAPPSGGAGVNPMRLALADYIERFEREFSSAVAEERYVQLLRPLRGTPSWPSDERALEWHDGRGRYPRTTVVFNRRQLLSDVLLVHTTQGWLGYRDVATVDGRAVRNRAERISRLFLSKDADRTDQLRRVAEESARYNVGAFRRTLNIPTLVLSFLHRRNHSRFIFSSEGRDQIDGRDVDILRYEEQSSPTLLGTSGGKDVPMTGRVWLDAKSGAVVQTELRVSGERRGELITRYREEPGFEVLVPDFMWEWYDAAEYVAASSVYTPSIVECLARYVKYRRFVVSTDEKIGR